MKKICLVYRRPVKEFFSIEKVFSIVKNDLRKKFTISEAVVPNNRVTVIGILQNMIYASRSKADVYHITGDIHYVALAFPSRKTILTIHDCVFLYRYNGLKKILLRYLFLKWPVTHSFLITTISEATKKDIIKYSGCPSEKVIVIPNPLPGHIRYTARTFRQNSPVLLFIGTTENKNLLRVIDALKGIICILHIIGVIPDDKRILLQNSGIEWENSFFLDEDQLGEKYCEADIILFPSLFEGFGLPILEGQKAGRPVITSDLEPMKNVAGTGACLVDPTSIPSIRQGILKVMEDANYRSELVRKGFDNITRFSPESIGEKYAAVYEQIK
ncbi:MAG: glycosyltransferase family 4 protein [Chitinophagaceae bacterium]|nr:glycosyltransferase family 4 protein [Chitinophagaceae bacterium]